MKPKPTPNHFLNKHNIQQIIPSLRQNEKLIGQYACKHNSSDHLFLVTRLHVHDFVYDNLTDEMLNRDDISDWMNSGGVNLLINEWTHNIVIALRGEAQQ
tara:strand:+ start:1276 stop:1575 length:300 start_codon:yes stop_codon:yes gene_type:complete